MKTVLISYLISNAICLGVIGALYWQNRKQLNGLGFWLAAYSMQFAALLLVAMRGIAPDVISMVVGNGLAIGGTILLYMGLEQFTDKRGAQWHNITLFIVFISIHSYFSIVSPSLTMRNINLALALSVMCAQSAWLLLRRVDVKLRPITRDAGLVFAACSLFNLGRIFVGLIIPSGDNIFHSNMYDTSAVLLYQMFSIAMTFGLFLVVNRRLLMELRDDNIARRQTEDALRFSEEKFLKAFHASPDSVVITRISDGRFVEVNEGFSNVTGYSRDEVLNSTSVGLQLWVNPQERKSFVQRLQKEQIIRNAKHDFRAKSGAIINGLVSAEIIQLGNEPHIISVVHDITDRNRMEEELRASEEKFKAITSSTPDHILVQDIDLRYQFVVNPQLGLTEQDILGKTDHDFLSKDDADNLTRIKKQVLESGQSVHVEVPLVSLEGKLEYFDGSYIPKFDTDGQVTGLIGYFRNVTERKQAEEESQRSEARYRAVVENQTEFIVRWKPDGTRTFANEAYLRCFGLTYEQAISSSFIPLVEESFRPAIEEKIARLASGLAQSETEVHQSLLPNGEIAWQEWTDTAIRDEEENLIEFQSVGRDITERVHAEQTLRQNEERLRFHVENSPLAVVEWDADYHVTLWSNEAERLFGWTASQAVGKQIGALNLIHEEDLPIVKRTMEQLSSGVERTVVSSNRNITREGKVIECIWYNSVLADEQGKMSSVMSLVLDVTQRKQAEENITRMNERFILASRAANLGVWDWDIQNNELIWDEGMYQLYGVKSEDFSGAYEAWLNGIHPADREASDEVSRQAQLGEKEYDTEFRIIRPDGEIRTIKAYGQVTRDGIGNPIRMTGVNYDITERKQADDALHQAVETLQTQLDEINILKETLQEQVIRDPLTNLYNRRYLYETIERELARAHREGYPVSVVMIDIDHFKDFNDIHGHQAGDEILVALGKLLHNGVRQGDVACRYGGEEFMLVMPGAKMENAVRRAEAIRQDFQNLNIEFNEDRLSSTVSLGVAVYPKHGVSSQAGRSQLCAFSPHH